MERWGPVWQSPGAQLEAGGERRARAHLLYPSFAGERSRSRFIEPHFTFNHVEYTRTHAGRRIQGAAPALEHQPQLRQPGPSGRFIAQLQLLINRAGGSPRSRSALAHRCGTHRPC